MSMSEPSYATPEDAEKAFYEAFQQADLDAMMDVWADEDAVVCIHPMGPRLDGREAVARSWQDIFSGGGSMRFELSQVAATEDDLLAVRCLCENISHGPRFAQRSLVLATNIYKMTDRGWRMILHHASPGATADQDASVREDQTLH
jgi:ketosteroid isomerase-like protein